MYSVFDSHFLCLWFDFDKMYQNFITVCIIINTRVAWSAWRQKFQNYRVLIKNSKFIKFLSSFKAMS